MEVRCFWLMVSETMNSSLYQSMAANSRCGNMNWMMRAHILNLKPEAEDKLELG